MRKNFLHLDPYRAVDGAFASPLGATYGAFAVPVNGTSRDRFIMIVDDGTGPIKSGWEHVSVRVVTDPTTMASRTPTWDEMSTVKSMFWDKDEVVAQFHVDNEDKVNIHPNVLHLWRPVGGTMPMPGKELV